MVVKDLDQVCLFQGASSRGEGDPAVRIYQVEKAGRLLVRDTWYEGNPEHFLHLTNAGEFAYVGGHVATAKASEASAWAVSGRFSSALTICLCTNT